MKKYVLTGGPSSGKTSIINALKNEGYKTVSESARVVLRYERMKKGGITRDLEATVVRQHRICERQLKKEGRLANLNNNGEIVFLDRGFHDSIAYSRHYLGDAKVDVYDSARTMNYDGVFILDLLPFKKDKERIEEGAEPEAIHGLIYDVYKEFGYKPVSVPAMNGSEEEAIRKRLEFILENVNSLDMK